MLNVRNGLEFVAVVILRGESRREVHAVVETIINCFALNYTQPATSTVTVRACRRL